MVIRQWRRHAAADTDETPEIITKAEELVQMGLKSKDALHLACALALKCDYFLTTDDDLIKKAAGFDRIKVFDPIAFIKEELA